MDKNKLMEKMDKIAEKIDYPTLLESVALALDVDTLKEVLEYVERTHEINANKNK